VKRSCYGVGVALLCLTGLRLPSVQVKATVPRFFIMNNLTLGRVKTKTFKNEEKFIYSLGSWAWFDWECIGTKQLQFD
jgi:hypothetical protein